MMTSRTSVYEFEKKKKNQMKNVLNCSIAVATKPIIKI